jgi:hypothetical protein
VPAAPTVAGHRLGALNDRLYALGRGGADNRLFHDVTTGDHTFHGPVTVPGFAARAGWDAASGPGSPQAATLVPRLARDQHAPDGGPGDPAHRRVRTTPPLSCRMWTQPGRDCRAGGGVPRVTGRTDS